VLIRANSLGAFFLASRPKTLGAIICPVLIGSSLALSEGSFKILIFVLTLFCALLLQILANLANDYADFLKGADGQQRIGPKRATASGLLQPATMRALIIFITVITFAIGAILVFSGGIFIALLGIFGLFLCFWYSFGLKYSLSHLGFSEIAVALFFGPLSVLGAYYMQSMKFSTEAMLASIGPACLSSALMLVNNLRDIDEDRIFNKMTTAVRFGKQFSRSAIIALICASMFAPLLFDIKIFWVGFSVIPAMMSLKILKEPVTSKFNQVLGRIGLSLYLYGLCMSAGILFVP